VAPARFAAMSWETVTRGIEAVLQSDAGRHDKGSRQALERYAAAITGSFA
jgi:hypothetical protein